MSEDSFTFTIDGIGVEATTGQTIIQACDAAGYYIPRLRYHPDLAPTGHCRVCTCKIDGRRSSACTMPAAHGMVVGPPKTADYYSAPVAGNLSAVDTDRVQLGVQAAFGAPDTSGNRPFLRNYPGAGISCSM